MDEARLAEFRTLLETRRDDLMREAMGTLEGMGDRNAMFADPVDRGTLEGDRNFQLRLRDRERKLLKKIEESLHRLEHGVFGECEECGEPIEEKRLRARPVTTLCIECKEEQERLEKMEL
jgi:DnaK suppressor protein